jgi:2-polyprenyl-6-methoxyphenol hydroxylase-like FAD-dependent oxidoreductase
MSGPDGASQGMHVIIAGGGIAGLALAHGLKKAAVSVVVFERGGRDSHPSWQQGYQIHINADGSRALNECLPPRVKALFDAKALQPSAGVQVLTPLLEVIRTIGVELAGSNPIVRSTLRSVLLQGLDDVVRFGIAFSRYEDLPDGRVKATFADGTHDIGDVLVGADGVRSAVRAQYLPHATVDGIGLVGTAGRLPIDDTVRSYLPGSLLTHLNGVTDPNGPYMIVTESIHKEGAGLQARSVDRSSDEHDHLIWVLVSSPEPYGTDPRSMFRDGPALQHLVLEQIAGWHPSLHRMVAETDPGVVSATELLASREIEPWDTTHVTLVGDAVHTMPPLRGLGGSTALKDAALLCGKLIAAARSQVPLLSAIHEYEAAMIEYGFAAVRSSLQFADMLKSKRLDPRRLGMRPGAGTNRPP